MAEVQPTLFGRNGQRWQAWNRTPEATQSLICEMYLNKATLGEICEATGVCGNTIHATLRRVGIPLAGGKRSAWRRMISEETAKRVCQLYQQGWTAKGIVKETGVSNGTVDNILVRCGIPRRGQAKINEHTGPLLTPEQMEIINGSLLGDGHVSLPHNKGRGNSVFSKTQRPDRREYLQWHFDKLLPYSRAIDREVSAKPVNKRDGKPCKVYSHPTEKIESLRFRTSTSIWLRRLREKWYPHGKKIVPPDIELTPLTVAVWFCDDGVNQPKSRYAQFCTNGFTHEECWVLVEKLRAFDVYCRVRNHNRAGDPVIVVPSAWYLPFIDLIRPHVPWPCFAYKVTLDGYKVPISMEDRPHVKLTRNDVRLIRELSRDGWILRELAVKFGVCFQMISLIVRGESWADVT